MTTLLEQINEEVKSGEVSEYNETQAALNELKETYGTEIPEAETKQGYARAKEIASKCRAIRAALENKRKEIKSPALDFGKLIDSKAKLLKAEIESIEQPFLIAYRTVDENKKQFKLDCEQRLIDIKNMRNLTFGVSSDDIENMIDDVACTSIDYETFGHKLDEAKAELPRVLEDLAVLKSKAIEAEIEQDRVERERIELEELRRQKAESDRLEQDRIEAEKQIARDEQLKAEVELNAKMQAELQIEKARQAVIDAENKANRDAEQAERDRIAAEQRAEKEKQEAIEAERQRQAQEQARIEVEAKAREEDKAHRAKINNFALKCFVSGGFTEKQAKEIITLIASKQVDNVTINY